MDQEVWAIAKWADVFEKSDSRKLKTLSWVSLPTGFSSNGYNLMLEEFGDDAAAIYGAWCALLKVAATCNRRGVLATASGRPIRLSHIARITGLDEKWFRRLFVWASSENVKWLVSTTYDATTDTGSGAGSDTGSGATSDTTTDTGSDSGRYPTPPNITGHNQTRPNPTGMTNGVGGGGGLNWDLEVAKKSAERLRKRFSRDVLPTGICLQVAMAASALEPDFISTLLVDCQGRSIGSPRHYVLKAATNMALRHGWEWNALVSMMPQGKQETATQ